MKRKTEYYPLEVCKTVTSMIPMMAFTVEEMRMLTEEKYPLEIKEAIAKAAAQRADGNVSFRRFSDLNKNDLMSMDFYSTVLQWSKNKQVYRFDPDFLKELAETENTHFAKDAWNYLPCRTFYLDISTSGELMERFGMQGVFVNVVKDEVQDSWELHTFRMVDGIKCKPYVLPIKNEDCEFSWDVPELKLQLELVGLMEGKEIAETRKANAQSLLLLPLVLSYLSSVEPDIRESEATKRTYRKPAEGAAPKNKFSEVKQDEVGVRFGTAYRKWAASSHSSGEKKETGTKTRSTKRPHFRKAHWQHFWYNQLDEKGQIVRKEDGTPNKIRRPKWVQAAYVNERLGEADAVIHKVHRSDIER